MADLNHRPSPHSIVTSKSFAPRPGGYPGASRDFWMPTVKCKRKTCVACYDGKCIAPALLEIGEDGMCTNFKPREDEKKKPTSYRGLTGGDGD